MLDRTLDDLSLTQRFERQIEEIQSKDIIGCGTRAIIKDSSRVTPNKSYFIPKKIVMNLKNPFVHGSMMLFKNEVIELEVMMKGFTMPKILN